MSNQIFNHLSTVNPMDMETESATANNEDLILEKTPQVGKIYRRRGTGRLVQLIADEDEHYCLQARDIIPTNSVYKTVEMTRETFLSLFRLVKQPIDGINDRYIEEIQRQYPKLTTDDQSKASDDQSKASDDQSSTIPKLLLMCNSVPMIPNDDWSTWNKPKQWDDKSKATNDQTKATNDQIKAINDQSSNVPEQLAEISRAADNIFENVRKFIELFENDQIQKTGTFKLLFEDNGLSELGEKLKLCEKSAQIEMEAWDDIKNMNDIQRGIYFLNQSLKTSN